MVTFPALESLTIDGLTMITKIWDRKLLPLESFRQLRSMTIRSCEKLLKVTVLKNGGEEEDKEENNNNTNSFLQLRSLTLEDLQSLKSFFTSRSETQSLFTSQVAFLVLDYLEIQKLPNIIEIWDKQLLIASEKESKSFCQLKDMTVSDCEKLVHVVQFNMLPRLQNLNIFKVDNCPKVEVIVSEKEKEEGTTKNDIIVLSQLTKLTLQNLMSLKSFYNWSTRFEAQPLFNNQSYVLSYDGLCICMGCLIPTLLGLGGCFPNNCPKVEVIVSEKEKEGTTNNDIIVFSQLTTLDLYDLVSLKSFYNWPTRSEAQPLFNHQVSFPRLETLILNNCVNSKEIHPWNVQVGKINLKFLDVANLNKLIVRNCSEVAEVFQHEELNVGEGQHVRPLIEVRMMELDALPQLTCLWNKDPHGILGLQILQYLTIKKCSLLRNLFTCSTAMALQQLKVLYLESCPVMEEVIAATEDGLKEVIDDVIEFPKLEWLILKDLPNLNSFYNAKYNFNFPSLQRVVLKRCLNMHNFTFGQVRMSQIFVSTHGNDGLQIEDLNKYLKERLLLKGEECVTVDENDHGYDEGRFSYLERL
ncbi:unnamed protein product [Camellia sinensis]